MAPVGENRSRKLIGLAGFMGCGKTTIGRLLAQQIGWRFVDLDTLIEQTAGLSIPAIFERLGEAAFREIEHEALSRTLGEAHEQARAMVVALGGGTIAQPANLSLLRSAGCTVIWLRCPIEVLLSRCATITNRPLFRDEASFRKLHEERLPFYEQADYQVDSSMEPRRVVEQILALDYFQRVVA